MIGWLSPKYMPVELLDEALLERAPVGPGPYGYAV